MTQLEKIAEARLEVLAIVCIIACIIVASVKHDWFALLGWSFGLIMQITILTSND